ncbi:MAG: sigma-70 family RNA polymerase sigma factor, partial [Opitutales bacterium]
MDDRELLQDYIERRSEAAFAELVLRHVNLVYSTALRVVRETSLAKDVAQTVFIALARKPRAIRDPGALGGWLYRAAHWAAAQSVRTEQRRRQREHEVMNQAELENHAPADWAAVGPLLDEAMRHLSRTDQDALVLRFFDGKSLRETGAALALSEDAAQKRVTRALDKMRRYFARRGVTATVALLAGVIAENSVQAAPTGLAANLANASLAGAGSAGAAGWFAKTFLMTTEVKAALAAAAVTALVAAPLVWQQWQIGRLHEALTETQAANAQLMADVLGPDGLTAAQRSAKPTQHKPTLAEIRAYIQAEAQKTDEQWDSWEFGKFLGTIPPTLLPQAMGFVEEVPAEDRRNQMRRSMLMEWAVHNPVGAMMYASNVQGTAVRQDAELTVVSQWVGVDALGAMAWVKQLPADDFKPQAAARIFGDVDPVTAWEFYQDLGGKVDGSIANDVVSNLFMQWTTTDRTTALAQAMELPAGNDRTQAWVGIAKVWAMTQPAAAMTWAAALPEGDDKSAAVKSVIEAWTEQDPQQAGAAAFSLPVGDARTAAITTLFNTWADTDVKAALDWVGQMPDGTDKQNAQEGLVLQWVYADPAAAMAYAQNLPPGNETNQVLKKMAEEWQDEDREAIAAWVVSAPPGPARDAAVVTVAEDEGSPKMAQLVMAMPKDQQQDTLRNMLANWTENDPDGAMTWLGSQPAGTVDNETLEDLGEGDMAENLAAAAQCLQA